MNTKELLTKWATAALEISKAYEAGDNDKIAELLKAQADEVATLAKDTNDTTPEVTPEVTPVDKTAEVSINKTAVELIEKVSAMDEATAVALVKWVDLWIGTPDMESLVDDLSTLTTRITTIEKASKQASEPVQKVSSLHNLLGY